MKKRKSARFFAVLLVWCMLLNCFTGNITASVAKAATTPDGLAVYTDLKWEDVEVENENGDPEVRGFISGVNDECEAETEPGTDIPGATWYFVNGSTPVTPEDLEIQDEEGTEITDPSVASLAESDEVKEGTANSGSYIQVNIYKIGTYRICLKDDAEKYITVNADLPRMGFYTAQEASDDAFIRDDYTYQDNTKTFYLITRCDEGETFSFDATKGKGITLDWGDVSDTDWSIEKISTGAQRTAVYKITISALCQADFALYAVGHVQSGDDQWDVDAYITLRCDSTGLAAQWPDWDDDGHPISVDLTEKTGDFMKSETVDLNEPNLYFLTVSQQGATQVTDPAELKLFYYENEAWKDVTADAETYGSITQNEDDNACKENHLFRVSLKKIGTYKVTTAGDTEKGVIFKVEYPAYGFYSTNSLSESGFLGYEYNYLENRTIYLLKNPNARGDRPAEITGVEVAGNETMTDVYVTTSDVTNGFRIDISSACTESFDLRILGTSEWGDPIDQTIYLAGEEESDGENYEDDCHRAAFTGCLISEWGFKTKNMWSSMPTVNYWVHGDSAQEVLDKLTAIGNTIEADGKEIPIKNTGYYYIVMSRFDGNTTAASNQAKAQNIRPAESVKGIMMHSGQDSVVAWGTNTPNYSEDDFYNVWHITKNSSAAQPEGIEDDIWGNETYDDFYGCYIENAGWRMVTLSQNGIYVYDMEAVIPDAVMDIALGEDENRAYKEEFLSNEPYLWPELTIDATGGVPVTLDGRWTEAKNITIDYSKKTPFSVEICGRTITQNDVAASVTVKDEQNRNVVVEFHCVDQPESPTPPTGTDTPAPPTGTNTPTPPTGTDIPAPTPPAKGAKVEDSKTGSQYKVTNGNAKNPTLEYTAPKKGAKGTVTVPNTVTINGTTYKVTSISANAFKNNTKVTGIVVGKNITDIGKNAFCDCKKLKTITIKSTKLTAKGIKKDAFNGISPKTTIQVPKKCLNSYKKLFVQKGLDKKVKVKK